MRPPSSTQAATVAAIALGALWLIAHRYRGIWHDGIFYAGQAVARMAPDGFRNDLFFAFGSQDDYSIVGGIYALLAQQIGLGSAALILLIAAHAAWAAAAFALVRQLLSGVALVAGLALLFALPRGYGPEHLLAYAEPFLTARSFAEPLVLGAIAAALAKRWHISLAALLLAFACHPLLAFPGALVLAFLATSGRRWPLPAIVAACIAAAFLPRMDDEWFALVQARSPFLLITEWTWTEIGESLTWVGILAIAGRGDRSGATDLWRAGLLAGATGAALFVIGSFAQVTLLVQGQPWRVLWLVKPLALLALAWLAARRWNNSPADRALLLALGAATITAETAGGYIALALALIERLGWRGGQAPAIGRGVLWLGGAAVAAVALETVLASLQSLLLGAEFAAMSASFPAASPLDNLLSPFEHSAAWILPLLAILAAHMAKQRPWGALLLSATLLAVALPGWHRDRDPVQRMLFARDTPRPFGEALPPSATVYWQDGFEYSWFLLKTGNYASTHQSAGLAFSRATALEAERRLANLRAFGVADAELEWRRRTAPKIAAATAASLRTLCQDGVIDAVILRQDVDGKTASTWIDPLTAVRHHLLPCRDFRH